MTRVYVLGNSTAPHGWVRIDDVVARLACWGVDAVVVDGSTVADVLVAAREVVAFGADRLIAVGGDGVVNVAVNAVAQTDTILGLIPSGTGNDFARALGMLNTNVDVSLERALAEPATIDAMHTDHGWVATVATLGFSGDVTARANALRRPKGRLRYALATILELPHLAACKISVNVDGRPLGGDTTLLAVGTTAYFGGGMRICPAAQPDDGRLQAVSIADVSRLRFLRVFPTVFSGRHVNHKEVSTDSGSVVQVRGDGIDVWGDGELLGPLPVTLTVVPGALQVAGATPP